MKDEQIILRDMEQTGLGQSSWDWNADYRFAKAIKATYETEILKSLLRSTAVFPIQIAVHKKFINKLKNRRLAALRQLQRQGIVYSAWIGTGHGGYSEFGVRRIKAWHLRKPFEANP
jgi:hypothetical protein